MILDSDRDHKDEYRMPDDVKKSNEIVVLATEAIPTCLLENNDPAPCQRRYMNVRVGKIVLTLIL